MQGSDLSGGGLMEISNIQLRILDKRGEENPHSDDDDFTSVFLNNTDYLLGSLSSWNQLNGSTRAYNATNNLIQGIPRCGLLFLNHSDQMVFRANHFLTKFQHNQSMDSDVIFPDAMAGKFKNVQIKIPPNVFTANNLSKSFVGTSYVFNHSNAKRFPISYKDGDQIIENDTFHLLSDMLDMTLPIPIHDLKDDERITVTFTIDTSVWVRLALMSLNLNQV